MVQMGTGSGFGKSGVDELDTIEFGPQMHETIVN